MNERDRRLEDIVEIVEQKESVTVEYLQELLGVSGSTVRSDLRLLVRDGKIHREHGKVTKLPEFNVDDKGILPSFGQRLHIHLAQKEAIAQIAESFIDDNDSIILDASSTCFLLAKRLVNSGKTLTVVTNSISAANLLHQAPRLQVILLGGTLGVQNNTEGTLGIGAFNHLNIKKCFISGFGVSLQQGVTDFSLLEIDLKRRFVELAQRTYALIDSSKFDVVSVGTVASLNDVDAIITDDELSQERLDEYQREAAVINPSHHKVQN
ncbi:DeoR/GlpR family DNA-binding transcription regulator [Alicyclobacillus sp. SO9]|uniref:DeoR/GlpR family DNA-binding transcription regulator n=1 Tax=Alicyclobacillus sp. SO9 TaxID=2665646 RepID=UPI0018E740C8|nr:DeoR/GlpR family DNA-binding transcription regulator [Alicyclobacillus sp. SO9]QQE77984.1 DeoR/GlpR transcriptional regulator [Alicyclobacillus sp. SO9]